MKSSSFLGHLVAPPTTGEGGKGKGGKGGKGGPFGCPFPVGTTN